MKKTSKQLAEEYNSGNIRPIIEEMDNEYEKLGLSENKVVSINKFASYKIGQWISLFDRRGDKTYGYIDYYIRKDREKPKETSWSGTLENPAFAAQMQTLLSRDKGMYAEFLLLEEKYINGPMLWAGIFNTFKEQERIRIGERIKQLREEAELTQDQLSEKTGLLKQNISRIEKGKYSTGQDILSNIARALGVSLDFADIKKNNAL
jgi:DNA-binding XRE family transcriptional regulator